jgi:hypothetical protein
MSLHSSRHSKSSTNQFRPRVETLEARTVPAVSVAFAGTTATVTGDAADNVVSIRDNGDGDLTITAGGTFTGNNVRRIVVNLHDGKDRFTYTQTGNRTRDMQIVGTLGNGNDLFTGRILGDINAFRTLDLQVDGKKGADGLDLTANSDVDIQNGAVFNARLFGGDARDRVDFNYQGELDGVLRYTLRGDAGDDNGVAFIRATVRADLGSSGQVGISGEAALVDGGSDGDSVAHFVFKNAADILLAVSAREDGGSGTDVGNRTTNVSVLNVESDFVV